MGQIQDKGRCATCGCDLTASAVKASFDRLFEAGPSGSSAPQNYLEYEAEITADDASGNVTVKTTRPYVDLTKNLAYPVMVILDVEHTTDYDHAAIGTGPYVAANFREEVGYTMVANEYYWDGDVPYAFDPDIEQCNLHAEYCDICGESLAKYTCKMPDLCCVC